MIYRYHLNDRYNPSDNAPAKMGPANRLGCLMRSSE